MQKPIMKVEFFSVFGKSRRNDFVCFFALCMFFCYMCKLKITFVGKMGVKIMCTAICDDAFGRLFGRTLDFECSFGEEFVAVPRRYRFDFLHEGACREHLAIIGVAHVEDGVPLFYDAMNEAGVFCAGLNFPISAKYKEPQREKKNIASFELIPFVLSNCKSADEAAGLLRCVNVTGDAYSRALPPSPLHWFISDGAASYAVEPCESGLAVRENPVGTLTNEPPLDYHLTRLSDFMQLGSGVAENRLLPGRELLQYSRGMGAIGLPGDFSSSSRFVRATFAKTHTSLSEHSSGERIERFFHIMDTVSVPRGCVRTVDERDVYTVYTSLADADTK